MNVALRYCDSLKNNLQASILRVQMLNRKYNTTDYTTSFSMSMYESPQKNKSTYQHISDNQSSQKKEQIRSIKDIEHDFNHIIVDGIKLRWEVETTATQLKQLRNDNTVESAYITKRRIQSLNSSLANLSSTGRHDRCFKNSSLDSFDQRAVASAIRSRHSFGPTTTQRTPSPRKRSRETFRNHSVIRSQKNAQSLKNGKKSPKFHSTPIKINEHSTFESTMNRSCSLNGSAKNSTSSFSQIIVDKMHSSCRTSKMYSPIKPCFRNNALNSNALATCNPPKQICWTPIVKVKKVSIYQ